MTERADDKLERLVIRARQTTERFQRLEADVTVAGVERELERANLCGPLQSNQPRQRLFANIRDLAAQQRLQVTHGLRMGRLSEQLGRQQPELVVGVRAHALVDHLEGARVRERRELLERLLPALWVARPDLRVRPREAVVELKNALPDLALILEGEQSNRAILTRDPKMRSLVVGHQRERRRAHHALLLGRRSTVRPPRRPRLDRGVHPHRVESVLEPLDHLHDVLLVHPGAAAVLGVERAAHVRHQQPQVRGRRQHPQLLVLKEQRLDLALMELVRGAHDERVALLGLEHDQHPAVRSRHEPLTRAVRRDHRHPLGAREDLAQLAGVA